ncbi:AAA family ATPase [Frigoribacterium sp. SL97]|uniref:AAA family ATPase n=1 Tax=Frigoribacterium sp. SL97 TaxID=2994664 RepID=UPI002270EA04|nr:AAA family ATPase [Frigoribacterium sp. SL97]WAC52164.1 AAA family ATPase [Frigoribacterium sp. SL97]
MTTEALAVDDVFPVRGYPKYTYQQQKSVEGDVARHAASGSGVLLVYGPSKSGKSVLVQKVLPKALYVEAPNTETAEGFWQAANTALGTHTTRSEGDETSESREIGLSAGVSSVGRFVGKWGWNRSKKNSRGGTSTDPSNIFVTRALLKTKRVLIIDDLHMLHRDEQRKIVRNITPFVDKGGRVILIASGHRAELIPTLVPNMGGSFKANNFGLWSDAGQLGQLAQIVKDGWIKLRTQAPAGLAERLAENAYGSPQTMQRLSAALVVNNNYYFAADELSELVSPTDWDEFDKTSLAPVLSEVRWVKKLTKGPKGKARDEYPTHKYGPADGYRLIMLALRELLPNVDVDVDVLRRKLSKSRRAHRYSGLRCPVHARLRR